MGLIYQVLLTAFFVIVAVWSHADSIRALSFLSFVGIPIWLFLTLVFHQRVLVADEAIESDELRREQDSGLGGAIFEVDNERLLLAQRRLRWMYKWLLPIFTLIIIGLLVWAGSIAPWSFEFSDALEEGQWLQVRHASLVIWFMGGAAFLTFLLSRYVVGMARETEWRLLRSGASWLMGLTLGSVAVAATLAPLHYSDMTTPEHVLAYVLRALLLVLAAEMLLNFVIDFYRPRMPDEEPRPAFESRLLGLFSEPGGVAKSIADAINYQFGFEVSSTWFYQLLQRSFLPLVGVAVLTLFIASSFVFIRADERAVLERFGKRIKIADTQDGSLGPGLHVKMPWPIDKVYKVGVERVHELRLSEVTIGDEEIPEESELLLWTNEHESDPHVQVLVATPRLAAYLTTNDEGETETPGLERVSVVRRDREEGMFSQGGEAVPVSILRTAVVIQYRIRDAWDWLTRYDDPQRVLETIGKRETLRLSASTDVMALLGPDRPRIERQLRRTVQEVANDMNLGIDIVFLGILGVHPPTDTAEAFQDVIGSLQKKRAAIRSAEAQYNEMLTRTAGDVGRAEQLADAIRTVYQLEAAEEVDPQELSQARNRVRDLFFGDADEGILAVGGEASGMIAGARHKRWELENDAHGEAVRFVQQVAAKQAAPLVYGLRAYLEAWADNAQKIRKYINASDVDLSVPAYQLNLQDPPPPMIDLSTNQQ